MQGVPRFGSGDNPYYALTDRFNEGRLRALLSSGQACVFYRLAMASKDGDWILREEEECLAQILHVLERHGAHYRLGAPLALAWMRGGWSAHFEFTDSQGNRQRCDFVTRPPRLTPARLHALWQESSAYTAPVLPPQDVLCLKQTMRMKDYPFIGSLARLLTEPAEQLRNLRSAEDLAACILANRALARSLSQERPLLATDPAQRENLENALDAEMRSMMRSDRARMQRYAAAMQPWAERQRQLSGQLSRLPLREQHHLLCAEAETLLPTEPDHAG